MTRRKSKQWIRRYRQRWPENLFRVLMQPKLEPMEPQQRVPVGKRRDRRRPSKPR